MIDIYLKLRDPDEINSSREHWRFVGRSISSLALGASIAVRDRRMPGVSPPHV
jgi:hypothetical protein